MRQEIFHDEYGIEAWDTSASSRCFIHIVNSTEYRSVTACQPPTEPITADVYQRNGIPWFDYYDGDAKALEGAPKLAGLDSVSAKKIKLGKRISELIVKIAPASVVKLGKKSHVREGSF